MASAKGLIESNVERLDGAKVKITMKVSAERLREGLHHVYSQNKHYFDIPGFRKGKAPRKMIEQLYGRDIFHDDANNYILPELYEEALIQNDLEPVYKPQVEVQEFSEADGAVYELTVCVRPEIGVGEYMGLSYPVGESEATEEEIEEELKREQEKNARIISVNRAAQMDDIVTINFKGYMDGEPFDGGSGEDFDLTLGSGQFIPGFEDQLVGHVVGDDVKVEVTFPEDYHAPEFSGKPATFEVEILDVKANEYPEINDEFAEDISEFDTLSELREDIAKKISETKAKTLDIKRRNHVLKKLVEASELDVPEEMYLGRLDDLFDEFEHGITSRGMDIENYMRFTGTNEAMLKASWRKRAEKEVKNMLVLDAVAKKENITVTDEEFLEKLIDVMGRSKEDTEKLIEEMSPLRKKDMMRTYLCEKAMDLIIEKGVASPDEEFEEDDELDEDHDDDEEI